MKNNFIDISKQAIDEIDVMNKDTMDMCNISYAECFPVYISREINIDNKSYGMSMEITIKPIKQRSKI